MKYCGKERGSITLFLALILSLLLSLVCTSIESVCMASARTQILNSMDIGLYSVFGQYDKSAKDKEDICKRADRTAKISDAGFHTLMDWIKIHYFRELL